MTPRSGADRRGVHREPDRRRGRPSLSPGEISESICFRLPLSVYDQLDAKAKEQRTTTAVLIRRIVTALFL